MKPNTQRSVRENVVPKSFNCPGIISLMTTNGKLTIAHADEKIANEKLPIGNQSNNCTSNFHSFSNKNTPKMIRPRAVPTVDTMYKN